MKVLEVTHKGIEYKFEYLEHSSVIEVIKADVPYYRITVAVDTSKNGYEFWCNCPGSIWHQHCWHIDGDLKDGGLYAGPLDVLFQPTINEPWAEWAEEAGRMKYANSNSENHKSA